MLTNPISTRQRTDAVRHGRFNAVIVPDTLYKQLKSTLPDYLHHQIDEAYRFDDAAMKAELQGLLMQSVVSDHETELLYV